jgi:hypothetical protein
MERAFRNIMDVKTSVAKFGHQSEVQRQRMSNAIIEVLLLASALNNHHTMKPILFALLTICTLSATAQRTMTDYVNKSCDIVWLGLDFTKMKFVASPWKDSPDKIKNETIPAWIEQLGESGRFDWKKAFQNDNLIIDYGPVTKANATIDESQFHTKTAHTINKETLAEVVKAFDMGERTDGIGCPSSSRHSTRTRSPATAISAFFDIGTRQLLHKQAVSGRAFGVTLYTYWAKAILGMRDIVASRVLRDVVKKYK